MDDTTFENAQTNTQNVSAQERLAAELGKVKIGDFSEAQDQPSAATKVKTEEPAARPLIIYTRKQILHLSQSPLIKLPDNMPSFKSWFGSVVMLVVRRATSHLSSILSAS